MATEPTVIEPVRLPQITESELRDALAARKRLTAAEPAREALTQDTLRRAAESRFEAAKYVSGGGLSPSAVFVEEPLIFTEDWTPHLTPHANIVADWSAEPRNSWVKVLVDDQQHDVYHGQAVEIVDTLTFWYWWENETAATTVVDVSAFMTVSGSWEARADVGSKHVQEDPNDPNYDPGASEPVYGSAHLGLSANLAVYQYWTGTLAPLQNLPDQQTQLTLLDVDVHAWDPAQALRSGFMFNAFELKQRLLVIPPDGRIFAEVSFNVDHRASIGRALADFATGDGNQVTSHWVEIAYVVAPPIPTTPVVGPARS